MGHLDVWTNGPHFAEGLSGLDAFAFHGARKPIPIESAPQAMLVGDLAAERTAPATTIVSPEEAAPSNMRRARDPR